MSPNGNKPAEMIISDGVIRQYKGNDVELKTPENVKGIDGAVFSGCQSLQSVALNEGLEIVGKRCFENCPELTTVVLPRSLRKLGEYAFADCSKLKFIRIPAGLKKIDAYVFKNCYALNSIRIPDSITEIEVGAFLNCRSLDSVHIPETVTEFTNIFGQHPFTGCDKIKIYTPVGSPAEEFAKENGIPYVNIKTNNPPVNKRHNEDYAVSPEISPVPKVTVQSGSVVTIVDPVSPGMDRIVNVPVPENQTAVSAAAQSPAEDTESAQVEQPIRPSEAPASASPSVPEPLPSSDAIYDTAAGSGLVSEKETAPASDLLSRTAAEAERPDPLKAEAQRKTAVYTEAMDLYRSGEEASIRSAIELMRSIHPYSDSGRRLKEFNRMLKNEQDYYEAIRCLEAGDKTSLKRAVKLFRNLEGYKESALGLSESRERLQELKSGRKARPAQKPAQTAKDTDLNEGVQAGADEAVEGQIVTPEAVDIASVSPEEYIEPEVTDSELAGYLTVDSSSSEAVSSVQAAEEPDVDKTYRVTRSESRVARSGYPPAAKPKKKPESGGGRGRNTVMIIVIILLLVSAAGAAYYLYDQGKISSGTKASDEAASDESQEKISTDYSATLEDFVKYNSEARDQIEQSVDGTNVSVDIKDNTLIYLYDLSGTEGLTEETADSDEVRSSLEATLDSGDNNFIDLCRSLEEDTGISGIIVEIRYAFGDKTILSRQYTVKGKK